MTERLIKRIEPDAVADFILGRKVEMTDWSEGLDYFANMMLELLEVGSDETWVIQTDNEGRLIFTPERLIEVPKTKGGL